MIKKCLVIINGETINGIARAETSTFVLVTWKGNPEVGEWFAKKSDKVVTIVSGE